MSVSVRGIASGIDVNGIIEELMELERQPIRRKEALIERSEQIAELWREVNTVYDTLQRTIPPLKDSKTFTAPLPQSSDEGVLQAKPSGMPAEGSYRFTVSNLATRHSVAMLPPTAGQRIANPEADLDLFGTFYLGTGRKPDGLESLTFSENTASWLRGSLGAGFQAVVDGDPATIYALEPELLTFAAGEEYAAADEIRVYMDSFLSLGGEDHREELEAYFAEKGWGDIDLDEGPLFVLRHDGEQWVAENQAGGDFAFLGDHPLGQFDLRGEVVDSDSGAVLAINNFSFQVREDVDETGLITIKKGDSLLTVAQRINQVRAETGVSADIIRAGEGDYRLVLESKVEGGDGYIQTYDYTPLDGAGETAYGGDAVLASLHLLSGEANAAVPAYNLEPQAAQDAVFTLNGLEIRRSSNTFSDVITGLEITLTGTGPATLEVKPDAESAIEEIKLFVEAINEVNRFLRRLQKDGEGPLQGSGDLMRMERQLRSLIHGMVPDVPGSNHLGEALRSTGSGAATATATGVYSGSLQNMELVYRAAAGTWRYNGEDFTSGDTVDGVRIDISGGPPVNGDRLILDVSPASEPLAYTSLAAVGIMASDQDGLLEIDEAKLREALLTDGEAVYRLFGREAPADAAGRPRGPHGLALQLEGLIRTTIGFNGVVDNRQRFLQNRIGQYENRIEMYERRLELREQRLVRQFTFMEQYIARIQEQTGLMASFEMMMQNRNE